MPRIITKARQLRYEKQAREGREVTLDEVAKAIGITRAALSNIELNKTERIDFDTLVKLCNYYGVGVGEVLEFRQDARKPAYATA